MDHPLAQTVADRIDGVVAERAEHAYGVLARLVGHASVLGSERGAQEELAAELVRLGFAVSWLDIPAAIADDPAAGVPALPYDGRHVLVARLAGSDTSSQSLLINGHLDVVPAGDDDGWSSPPFSATVADGWMTGRGAGDMKAGFAMTVLALEALLAAGRPLGALTVVAVIEEECTGNGTLASIRAGVLADAVLLPEPTDLAVLTSGVGVVWADIRARGAAGHAESAPDGVSAMDGIATVMAALQSLSDELNSGLPAPRYHINIGRLEAGDWPSTVPGSATLRVRIGFPHDRSPDDVFTALERELDRAIAGDPWMREHPPTVRPSGFRAAAYQLPDDAAVLADVRAAHADAHGAEPEVVGSNGTTDARFYLNEADVPALCYGPRTRGMHGADEAVELASIDAGARTLARFMAGWLGLGPGDGA